MSSSAYSPLAGRPCTRPSSAASSHRVALVGAFSYPAPSLNDGSASVKPTEMAATRVLVIRGPCFSTFEYVPVDETGQSCWPFRLEWNRQSPLYRTRPAAAAAARLAFPDLPIRIAE